MKRSKPIRRRTPLRQVGRKRRSRQVTYSRVRSDVQSRSRGLCELGTGVCTLRGSECHHLLPRSAGGPDSIANCVWACGACHRYVHAHPAESYAAGWLRHREAS